MVVKQEPRALEQMVKVMQVLRALVMEVVVVVVLADHLSQYHAMVKMVFQQLYPDLLLLTQVEVEVATEVVEVVVEQVAVALVAVVEVEQVLQ
jgi:hypothetical protein